MSLQAAFHYLLDTLRHVKTVTDVRVLDQGALLVDIAQPNFHEEIVIYLLAGELSVGFIKKTLNANTQRDRHTLFIVSLDLISEDGTSVYMTDALRLLLQAFGDKVYAYRIDDQGVNILPVYINQQRQLTFGDPVDLADLSGDYATFDNKYLLGVRKVATFQAREWQPAADDSLRPFYEILGLTTAASETEVKKAYRRKALQHHPDTDSSPDATRMMQQINEAYMRIMQRFQFVE